jgi:hypothetical protein
VLFQRDRHNYEHLVILAISHPESRQSTPDSASGLKLSPYVGEYLAAIDRTQEFGFDAPPRLLVKKDCVDVQTLRPVLLDSSSAARPIR